MYSCCASIKMNRFNNVPNCSNYNNEQVRPYFYPILSGK